ncbi:MAG: HAD family phosphatase [Kiloniellales bacterium]
MQDSQRAEGRPTLVIFDCDGVLVDSEPVSGVVLQRILKARGEDLTIEEIDRRYRGWRLEEVATDFFARRGEPLDPSLATEIRDTTMTALGEGIEAIDGVGDLLRQLIAAGIDCCVASSGSIEKMHLTLGQTGLLPLLQSALYTAQDVPNGKPAPDVFLHAAKGMGRDPAETVVIEDSAAGARGARAAGMRVIGYSAGRPEDEAALHAVGADVVARMDEVPALIGIA